MHIGELRDQTPEMISSKIFSSISALDFLFTGSVL